MPFAMRPMLADGLLWVAAVAAAVPAVGVLAWITPLVWRPHWPSIGALFWFVLVAPTVEEIVFRGGLQEWLLRRDAARIGPISRANGLASVVFAACHLIGHPPAWAAAMVLPSLLFGLFYERARRLGGPIVLHAVYNAAYLALLGAIGGPALLP
ncbi:JDVT-CTERM system glutamic-type intramembrane protease MrtJ [Salinisphaera hydrothermalis]|uniref:JDVT-CTERM system glutamic-type intramembrane protease MrtJ n=1 Tax=Salinisphaera hydrothermalis TaxID=563188 RepID=UPI003341EC29